MHDAIGSYSRVHRHFFAEQLSPALLAAASTKRGAIADLGAGDGAVLWALEQQGLLGEKAYAVDISPDRVAAAERISPKVRGIVADATNVPHLDDESVDGVLVSQVIEHLPDDRLLAPEIARLVRPGGWWYVGSVLRSRHAWWIYKVDGVRRLDPTHVREYESPQQLMNVLSDPRLEIREVRTAPISYAVIDLLLRAAALGRLLPFERLSTLYLRRPRLAGLRRLRIRPPGFCLIEVWGVKHESLASDPSREGPVLGPGQG